VINRAVRLLIRIDQAAGGLTTDLSLYALSTAFAAATAATSTLLPHRAWGAFATGAYAAATLAVIVQLLFRVRLPAVAGTTARATLTWTTWLAAAVLPLIVEAVQRAAGRTDRAQEEVAVVERMGARLLEHGTPYLSRDAIAALPADDRLAAYSPYQTGMSVFGLPRALAGDIWWTDARIWFAITTAAALLTATTLLRPRAAQPHAAQPATPHPAQPHAAQPATPDAAGPYAAAQLAPPRAVPRLAAQPARPRAAQPCVIRALQAATVLPVCALTLATGGDDIPVLALCLLALALIAADRFGLAGIAVGAAAAAKLFAFPVVAVLIVLAVATGRTRQLLPGALGLPVLVLIPPLAVAPDAFVENVLRFPLGHGLVTSPAQSPFPGYLIAQNAPGGRFVALGLLLAVAATLAVRMIRRPPRTATAAALICGWGLLAAILLMPTTRFGYLLYPLAFLVWSPALASTLPIRADLPHRTPAV
jgi:hypothetical protein